jgi:hypothetical protein
MQRFALISNCNRYRYMLGRMWNEALPRLIFVMLNPSTADSEKDDRTVIKCIGFAKHNGYGSILIVNIWAYRATKPSNLRAANWDAGPLNDKFLQMVLMSADTVVCAWGINAKRRLEPKRFINSAIALNKPLYALEFTKDGIPSHPLMLSYSCKLTRYDKTPTNVL